MDVGVRKGEDKRERCGDVKKKKKSNQFSHQFMFPSLREQIPGLPPALHLLANGDFLLQLLPC